ncbi:MAG: aminotransferase class I/II-fold pyridoxal phosphate-dependent enzyme [Methanoculleus sp.]
MITSRRLLSPRSGLGKQDIRQTPESSSFREAICTKCKRENDLVFQPEQILVTAGGSEALHLVMEALVDPGDRVLVPDPGFVSYAALATFAGGRPEGMELDETLHIDVERAKEQMDGARIVVLNSPANPTGVVESEESIRALVEYADDCGVTVVTDEVYEHFIYEKKHVSAGRFGDDVITINAASKTYAMTGWRVGYLAAPEDYIPEFLKIHQYAQACATSISQYAALAAYTGDQRPVARMREEPVQEGISSTKDSLALDSISPDLKGLFTPSPLGRNLIERAIEDGVIIVPGGAFGSRAPDYARFSHATSRENLSRAVERLAALVE